jgi:hypothetical protein
VEARRGGEEGRRGRGGGKGGGEGRRGGGAEVGEQGGKEEKEEACSEGQCALLFFGISRVEETQKRWEGKENDEKLSI